MWPVAFSTLACPDWSWPEILRHAGEYGYDGVELRLLERQTDLLVRPEFQPSQLAQRRRELEQAGLRICGLGSSVRFDHDDPALIERDLITGMRYLDLAAELGAGFVRVFGDVVPEEPAARRSALDRIAESLQAIGEAAEERGIDVLLETHGDFADSSLTAKVLAQTHSPALGVLWDTHHPWRFLGEPLTETHARLARWIRHTHFKDSVSSARRGSLPESQGAAALAHSLMSGHRHADYVLFGQGEFPARACLALLAEAGYTGWISYEWERMWHPEIEPPEEALPPFPGIVRGLWSGVSS